MIFELDQFFKKKKNFKSMFFMKCVLLETNPVSMLNS